MDASPVDRMAHVMKNTAALILIFLSALLTCNGGREPHGTQNANTADEFPVSTFSIVAWDEATGDLGVAVQSRFFGVGSVVPWARAGVGAIATQSYANTQYGPEGLALLGEGLSSDEVLNKLTAADEGRARRQAAIVDASGAPAAYTGSECLEYAGHHTGRHYSVQGNILESEDVLKAMSEAFESRESEDGTPVDFAGRLVNALTAAQEKGGDRRGKQSAALLVVRKNGGYAGLNDRFIDLRVEDHPEPIRELSRLLDMHRKFYRRAHENPPRRPEATDAGSPSQASEEQ